jgi:hypothetical protein
VSSTLLTQMTMIFRSQVSLLYPIVGIAVYMVRQGSFSPTMVRVIKSRRMRWTGHVAGMEIGERRVQGFGGKT